MLVNQYKKQNIDLIEITSGDLVITLSTLGAAIYSIKYLGVEMTHTPKSFSDWVKPNSYYGKTIGPVSGRVVLKDRSILLHGGKDGLSNKIFKSSFSIYNDRVELTFNYSNYKIIYIIYNDSFEIKYDVELKKESYISLTNHTYFTLGERNIENLSLKIDSNSFVEVDKNTLLPLNNAKETPCFDFKEGKLLSKDINDPYLMEGNTKGYDHYLYFDKDKTIELSSPRFKLTITTNFEGTQIYTDNYYDFEASHTDEKTNRSVAIEPQDKPIQLSRKRSDGKYSRFIKYKFESL